MSSEIGNDPGYYQPSPTTSRLGPVTPRGPQAYKGNGNHDWENVTDGSISSYRTTRLRVPGGFLYRYGDGDPVFVPMPDVVGYVV